uniref:Peptidase A1 domain-containing protein n=1 Tax=Kalanchoe fedtschenkoi TaxID=63787 RepID=A0A7N0ULX2_KALFE
MASTTIFVLTFTLAAAFSSLVSAAASKPQLGSVTYPIIKDTAKTRLYYTTLQLGTPAKSLSLTLTLAGQFIWFDCEHKPDVYNSTSYQTVHCDSPACEEAGGVGCLGCLDGPPRPGCTNDTCPLGAYNPFNDFIASAGLYTDILRVPSRTATVRSFPFACGYGLNGLPKASRGMLGLAMTKVAFQAKVSSALKLANIFALCLPSTGAGKLLVGGGPYSFAGNLVETPIIINPNSTAAMYSVGDPSDEYFLGVKSIKVAGVPVALNSTLLSFDKDGYGGTKVSTMDPHTVLHSDIYRPLVNAFTAAARALKMKRAANYGYFRVCYTAASIGSDRHGRIIPTIDLVLQNESTYWRMYGSDLMVRVSNNVLCLGMVEAGKNPRTAIVIGGRQMENRLVEFDLVASKLRFSEPLIRKNTSCSG